MWVLFEMGCEAESETAHRMRRHVKGGLNHMSEAATRVSREEHLR